MGDYRNRMLAVGALSLVVLTGCSNTPVPTPAQTTTPPPPTATATSTPRPTVTLTPELTALTAESSYKLCVAEVSETYAPAEGGSPSDFVAVPFAEAEVVDRGDGYFWVWADFENNHAPAELKDAAALTCIVGGTVEEPEFPLTSTRARSGRADTDPYFDFTQPQS